MEISDIVFVEYNGHNKPFSVWTKSNDGYDFSLKNGYLIAEWSSHYHPCLCPFANPEKMKIKRKLWFTEEFRPTHYADSSKILSNDEIQEMGYEIIQNPLWIEEILEALNN